MIPLGSLRTRPGAALAALGWLLGTIVLPVRHLARHALPHDHEGGGIHYHLDADAGGDVHDEHGEDHDDDVPGGPFTVETPHSHGRSHDDAGLAHFAAATGDGVATTLVLSSEPDPERIPDALPVRHAVFFLEGKEPARGPPPA